MFNGLSNTYKGILLALGGYSAFSVADLCAKWLAQSYSIYQIITFENAFALGLLLAFAPFFGGSADIGHRKNLKIHVFRAVINAATLVLLTYCYREFPIANVYTILFTKPFFVTLLALWLFKETCGPSRWAAIVIGFVGVVIAMQPGAEAFDPRMLLPLAGAVMIAVLFISSRSLENPSPFSLAFFPAVGAILLCLPFTVMTFKMPGLSDLPVFILIGLGQVAGMTMVSLAYRTTAAAVVSPFLYVEMIWALVFGWLIFKDVPGMPMLIGAGVIILSGIYLVETERRKS
jgi:drug/metabolite transporter (DMT)-like permease